MRMIKLSERKLEPIVSLIRNELKDKKHITLDVQRGTNMLVLIDAICEARGVTKEEVIVVPGDEYTLEICNTNNLNYVDVIFRNTDVPEINGSSGRDLPELFLKGDVNQMAYDKGYSPRVWVIGNINGLEMSFLRELHVNLKGEKIFVGDSLLTLKNPEEQNLMISKTRARLIPSPIKSTINSTYKILMLVNNLAKNTNIENEMQDYNSKSLTYFKSNQFEDICLPDDEGVLPKHIVTNYSDDLHLMNYKFREKVLNYEGWEPRVGELVTNFINMCVTDIYTKEEFTLPKGSSLNIESIQDVGQVYYMTVKYNRAGVDYHFKVTMNKQVLEKLYLDDTASLCVEDYIDHVFYGYVISESMAQEKLIRNGAILYVRPDSTCLERFELYKMLCPITDSVTIMDVLVPIANGVAIMY